MDEFLQKVSHQDSIPPGATNHQKKSPKSSEVEKITVFLYRGKQNFKITINITLCQADQGFKALSEKSYEQFIHLQ